MPENNPKNIVKVDELPESVYDWAVSGVLTGMIRDLNHRLGLDGIRSGIIPDLIGDIIIRVLPPDQLVQKISEYLELDRAKAATVAKEIEEKMLRPIEVSLRRELGVDIKMIYLGAQVPSRTAIPQPPPLAQPKPSIPAQPQPAEPARPLAPTGTPSPIYRPATPTPQIPQKQPSPPANIPVKINVQPVRQAQDEKEPAPPAGRQPFGPDSWVNRLK